MQAYDQMAMFGEVDDYFSQHFEIYLVTCQDRPRCKTQSELDTYFTQNEIVVAYST